MLSSVSAKAFSTLPVGSIKPAGWLLRQLRIQANGLSGHLDEFWPSVAQSRWIGGEEEGWERAPYWLDGFVPLALLLQDERLIGKARKWIDYILDGQHEDGWLGPREDPHKGMGETVLDPWPLFVLFKALAQWQEGTGDERVIPAMTKAMRRIDSLLDEKPLDLWAKMRWIDLVLSIYWLYERTGEVWLLALGEKVAAQGYSWSDHYRDFRFCKKQTEWKLENHVVNHAMSVKEPALRFALLGDRERWLQEAQSILETLDRCHGQATGLFSGDESLAGRSPSQGTELCAVVEFMFSLEKLLETFGAPEFADRLEQIAYNALPATFTRDMWGHQYDQQANQVVCKVSPKGDNVYVSNGPESNLFGIEPNFGCCTANMHQGWPKLVEHLWMRNDGLVAAAYGPCVVKTHVDGVLVCVVEETDYPFRDKVTLTLQPDRPVRFPLSLRIPQWAKGTSVRVNSEEVETVRPGEFLRIDREWRAGDQVTLAFAPEIHIERRFNEAVSVRLGPLVFSLQVGEEFRLLRGEPPKADWEVYPATPWNYGIDLTEPLETVEGDIPEVPFSTAAPAIKIKAKGRLIPEWTLEKNAAAPPPVIPVPSSAPLEEITLVPYGSTHLRVTELPEVSPKP